VDAFETVIASILQRQGFWTMTSLKVELTKAEKVAIGRSSSPRWEIDVVGYSGASNELRVIECKSYLDSYGVHCSAFDGSDAKAAKRYKLFCEPALRDVVLRRLVEQLVAAGFCREAPKVTLCLAAGKIKGDEAPLREHFQKNGWTLYGPDDIRNEIEALRDSGYENSVAAVVAKILLRGGGNAKIKRVPTARRGLAAMNVPTCRCCERRQPPNLPRLCPECPHVFRGNGWDGIDAHWRSAHEDVMPYEDFWKGLCANHGGSKAPA
jgi:hypothetical protein